MKEYKGNLPQIELKYKKGTTKKVKITCSSDIATLCKEIVNLDTIEINEEVLIIYLNRANNTIGWIRHTTGGSIASIIDVKLILSAAITSGAQGIIMVHNHPSGILKPSKDDIKITDKLKNACDLIDLTLLDSIIVGPDLNHYSFADNGDI
jgi:DNA repair protein RadC